MSNFKVGQRVICIKQCNECVRTGYNLPAPIIDQELKISEFSTIEMGFSNNGWLIFKEFGKYISYEPWNFRPLHHEFAKEVISMLLEQPEKIEL